MKKAYAKQSEKEEKEVLQPQFEQQELCFVCSIHFSNCPWWAWGCNCGKRQERSITTPPIPLYHTPAKKIENPTVSQKFLGRTAPKGPFRAIFNSALGLLLPYLLSHPKSPRTTAIQPLPHTTQN